MKNKSIAEIMGEPVKVMEKFNVQEVLMQNGKESQYAIIKYNINKSKRIMAFYFIYDDNEKEFLPYLCWLQEIRKCKDNNKAKELFEFLESKSKCFIKENYVIINEIIYEINKGRLLVPFLPKEVDAIISITEKEFILYTLEFEPIILYKLNISEFLDMKWNSKESMRKGLVDSGNFDADTVDKVIDIFCSLVPDYSFET